MNFAVVPSLQSAKRYRQVLTQRPVEQKAQNKQGASRIITVWTMSLNERSHRANRRMSLLTFAALIHFLVNYHFGCHFGRLYIIAGWHLFVIVVY